MAVLPDQYVYRVITFPAGTSYSDEEIEIEGEEITYFKGDVDVEIRLNSRSNDKIPLSPKDKLEAPFHTIYVTFPTTTAGITLFISKPKEIKIESQQIGKVERVESIGTLEFTDMETSGIVSVAAGGIYTFTFTQAVKRVDIWTFGADMDVEYSPDGTIWKGPIRVPSWSYYETPMTTKAVRVTNTDAANAQDVQIAGWR